MCRATFTQPRSNPQQQQREHAVDHDSFLWFEAIDELDDFAAAHEVVEDAAVEQGSTSGSASSSELQQQQSASPEAVVVNDENGASLELGQRLLLCAGENRHIA